ncbi:hypothetical protein [Ilumatobacter sp.]|uniref:hypothetical protein n=1 Tax=Ilumatobacter sp. TaxID=1967498 RepID=UPI003B526436
MIHAIEGRPWPTTHHAIPDGVGEPLGVVDDEVTVPSNPSRSGPVEPIPGPAARAHERWHVGLVSDADLVIAGVTAMLARAAPRIAVARPPSPLVERAGVLLVDRSVSSPSLVRTVDRIVASGRAVPTVLLATDDDLTWDLDRRRDVAAIVSGYADAAQLASLLEQVRVGERVVETDWARPVDGGGSIGDRRG